MTPKQKRAEELRGLILQLLKSDVGLRAVLSFDSLTDSLSLWKQFPTPHELADHLRVLEARRFVKCIERSELPGKLGGDERLNHIEFVRLTAEGFDAV